MAEDRVIALHGPRSVGKSTLLRILAPGHGVAVIDLDDIGTREAVAGNLALVTGGKAPLCIAEYQRLPDVLDEIKPRLNREGSRPGTAVITGSARQDALPATAQALVGRLHTVTLWPLSQGELEAGEENLLEALRVDPDTVVAQHATSGTTREDYAARVCAGGLPLAVRRSESARARWFRVPSYRLAAECGSVRQRRRPYGVRPAGKC